MHASSDVMLCWHGKMTCNPLSTPVILSNLRKTALTMKLCLALREQRLSPVVTVHGLASPAVLVMVVVVV